MIMEIAQIMSIACEELHRESKHLVDQQAPLRVRVGSGKATNHKRREGVHTITFGVKMVEDHFTPGIENWTSSKEMKRAYRGRSGTVTFHNKKVLPINALAHVVCHEYSHYTQVLKGGRSRGSVHNNAFYRELVTLYEEGLGEMVKKSIEAQIASRAIDLDRVTEFSMSNRPAPQKHAGVERHEISVGDSVYFMLSGTERKGEVIKKNPSRVKVIIADRGGICSVPYRILSSQPLKVSTPSREKERTPANRSNHGPQDMSVGDSVSFEYRGRKYAGTIIKKNPKKARVQDSDGQTYAVPYSMLKEEKGREKVRHHEDLQLGMF